jgi:cytidylate kinase
MNKINVITIDGPSASGKGSLAREIAKTYDLSILDSGSLYRLYAYFAKEGMKSELISNAIQENIEFKISNQDLVIMNVNNDITDKLRSESIASLASELSSKKRLELHYLIFKDLFIMTRDLLLMEEIWELLYLRRQNLRFI